MRSWGVVQLCQIGKYFAQFHVALEDREATFTTTGVAVAVLGEKVHSLLNDKLIEEAVAEVVTILKSVSTPQIAQLEQLIDAPVRVRDATTNFVAAILREHASEFQDAFNECVQQRFENHACAVTSAFHVFDPPNFPRKVGANHTFKEQLRAHGTAEIAPLTGWYEVAKCNDEEKFDPPIDATEIEPQWMTFKIWISEHISRGGC